MVSSLQIQGVARSPEACMCVVVRAEEACGQHSRSGIFMVGGGVKKNMHYSVLL